MNKGPFLIVMLMMVSLASAQSDYLIAYNVLVNGEKDDYDIFVMNPDGTGKRNITNNADVAWTYHAYEDTVFFISDRDTCKRCVYLYTMGMDGSNVRKVSNLRLEDSWMSTRNEGADLVVSGRTSSENRRQLFVIDVKTGNFEQITHEKGALFRDPLFSPDGKQIVYVYKADASNREVYEDLYIMDADGKNPRRLTFYPKDDKTSKWHSYHAGPPKWNRKENFITYQSWQNGKSSLYAVTPDGKKQWKLTNNQLNEGWHDWSPDGKWLAIEMYDKANTEFGIYLMNWKTKEVKKLTDPKDSRFQQAPVFLLKNSGVGSQDSAENENRRR
ncbi:MAG: hypothetical protein OEM82_01900 [Acidobacteriota bacterium]|nr:hypothetical protein [Acidobacteriota bacterium]MDH3529345.1 hypothetical protein [Acidobacteriota bacterium]